MNRKAALFLMILLSVVVVAGLSFADDAKTKPEAAGKGNMLYVCNCGGDCKCNTVSIKPGKCKCGGNLAPMHVLKIEKDEALLCSCGKGCDCRISADDPTKCGCGSKVKRVNLKGMYVCKCGEGCTCNTISDKPGKCRCGNELRKVE